MTIQEAKFKYGTRVYRASRGMTLKSVARKIYNSDDYKYIKVLKSLNIRFDWFCLQAGAEINYLDLKTVNQISEV